MSTAETFTDEQARLLSHAESIESTINQGAAPGAQEAAQEAAQGAAQEDENEAILSTLVALAAPALPFLPDCYTPEVIRRIAVAYTAVERKHGWNVRELLNEEAQLALVAIPPTLAAIMLGRAYFAAKAAQEHRPPEKDITPRPGDQANGNE